MTIIELFFTKTVKTVIYDAIKCN